MPIPFIAAAAGAATTSIVGGYVNAFIGPALTEMHQKSCTASPIEVPSPGAIIDALNKNFLSREMATLMLLKHGINLTGTEIGSSTQDWSHTWEGIAKASQLRPTIDLIMSARVRDIINPSAALKALIRAGGDWASLNPYTDVYRSVPSPEVLTNMVARGIITSDEWKDRVIRAGGDVGHWGNSARAYWSWPTAGEIITLRNRGDAGIENFGIKDDEMKTLLIRNGFADKRIRQLMASLRFSVPSISDLITMQVRETFQPEIANDLGLYDERPSKIEPYFAAQGLDWGPPGLKLGGEEPRDAKWSDLYWGMHWHPLAAGQAFTAWQRVREDTVQRYIARGLDVKAVTLEQVRKWLRIQDYPKGVRDYLLAISFAPLRLIDIRNALRLGVAAQAQAVQQGIPLPAAEAEQIELGREWAIARFRDRGLHPDDALTSANLAIALEDRRKKAPIEALQRQGQTQFLKATLDGYRLGIIGRDVVRGQLALAGVKEDAIALWIGTIDAQVRLKIVNQTVSMIRRRYIDGATSRVEAEIELKEAGIVAGNDLFYLSLWDAQRSQARRMTSTSQILGWHREGLLPLPEAVRRLRNLGWRDPDILLHLADVQLDQAKDLARQQQAALRSRRAAARELERIQASLTAQQRRIQSDLRRISPISTLKRWLKGGYISPAFFRRRAANQGYPAADIERYLREALAESNGEEAEEEPGPPEEEEEGVVP